jgi:hypothetical protein
MQPAGLWHWRQVQRPGQTAGWLPCTPAAQHSTAQQSTCEGLVAGGLVTGEALSCSASWADRLAPAAITSTQHTLQAWQGVATHVPTVLNESTPALHVLTSVVLTKSTLLHTRPRPRLVQSMLSKQRPAGRL